jgi:hypothetical protein
MLNVDTDSDRSDDDSNAVVPVTTQDGEKKSSELFNPEKDDFQLWLRGQQDRPSLYSKPSFGVPLLQS